MKLHYAGSLLVNKLHTKNAASDTTKLQFCVMCDTMSPFTEFERTGDEAVVDYPNTLQRHSTE
jgi:nitrate/TMAO reductase-like tetraheme cytochrome c subunit